MAQVIEFVVLVEESEVGQPEFSGREVQICDAVKVAFVPLQPVVGPFLQTILFQQTKVNI